MDAPDRAINYIPSTFEREWRERLVGNDEDGCGFIKSNANRVKTWLAETRV